MRVRGPADSLGVRRVLVDGTAARDERPLQRGARVPALIRAGDEGRNGQRRRSKSTAERAVPFAAWAYALPAPRVHGPVGPFARGWLARLRGSYIFDQPLPLRSIAVPEGRTPTSGTTRTSGNTDSLRRGH